MQEAKTTTLLVSSKKISSISWAYLSLVATILFLARNNIGQPSLVAPIYPETMNRSRFLEIKKYLHLANNENLSNSKTAKVDPLYHKLLMNCQQSGIFH